MLITKKLENNYQDSINLMLLTNKVNKLSGVTKAQVMMGTDANKDIFKTSGLHNEDIESAAPNDLVIAVETDDASMMEKVTEEVNHFLKDLSVSSESAGVSNVSNWNDALKNLPEATVALFSIPGEYAAYEVEKALDKGLHAFVFSDNISIEDEVRLKKKAHDKGLLVMGPDCGTGILAGVPYAFTNVIRPGNIGIVGASGTGIQEVTTIIDRFGGGVVNAVGTGGRDLSEEVGAITTIDALYALENDDTVDVITVISKPPAEKIREKVIAVMRTLSKPVVATFVGETYDQNTGNVYYGNTLEETARIAVDLANNKEVKDEYEMNLKNEVNKLISNTKIVGLYSGGTLASEAAHLIKNALKIKDTDKREGVVFKSDNVDILDLGDDQYTQGKPHPMIDPEIRLNKIRELGDNKEVGVLLLDVVLGFGSHSDMAGALVPAITDIKNRATNENRELHVIATVCGTPSDPQEYATSIQTLEDAGVLVEESNARAVGLALKLIGSELKTIKKTYKSYDQKVSNGSHEDKVSPEVMNLLTSKPSVINVGIESFSQTISQFGGKAVQYNWKPKANGNKKLITILNKLDQLDEINDQNERVVERFKKAAPYLIDVVPAHTVIPELKEKVLLHAGPPIQWEDMTGPMKGSCFGAALFEGWADTEEEALKLFDNGEVKFIPCHHVKAVGPMGGITSGNMAVMVVENRTDGNLAFCTMNEGIGKVLRFGAFSEEVVERLHWMKDVLGPVISKAVKQMDEGLNLNVIVAKSIAMGDEFHQRNHAASLNFLKAVGPIIVGLKEVTEKDKQDVIQFLADTDQFFLNVMMALGKAIVDGARKIEEGTIVTTLTRNGKDFGVRISGLGDEWFTAPVNNPKGLYFTGFTEEDGNPDIGDSAINEALGLGAMAMVAAPAVTRFVGAGGFNDALEVSNEMDSITISNNENWSIPTWNFKGAALGIDIRRVVETGITPIINTGIAHKKPGLGQVGAGTVRAPLACFEKALIRYAESIGINVEGE